MAGVVAIERLYKIFGNEPERALADRRGWAYSTVKTMLDRMVDEATAAVHAREPMQDHEVLAVAWGRIAAIAR